MPNNSEEYDELDFTLDKVQEFAGNLFANGRIKVLRPNYLTGEEVVIDDSRIARIEQVSAAYGSPRISGIENYSLVCRKLDLQFGDVLVQIPIRPSAPIVTIFTDDRKRETVCFRSNRICQLGPQKKVIKYNNVRFDFMGGLDGAESPINPDMEGSPNRQARKAVLIAREDVIIGWKLITTIAGDERVFHIAEVGGTGMVMTLDLVEAQ